MQYPSLILKPGREKSVVNRHPWIFSGGVLSLPKATNGDIITVLDHKKSLLGYGFFSPDSQITCRLFEFTQQPVEVGTASYWQQKIVSAYHLRKNLLVSSETDGYRLLHAEGDFLPGIIADVYGKLVVVQLLIKGTERIYPMIAQALKGLGFDHVYLKNKQNTHSPEHVDLPNGWLSSLPLQENAIIKENGLKFLIDFEKGQKTGFFLDQRDNRSLLKHYSAGKKVLNAFSYTGGFSVYALAGGAANVHSVDISREATEQCEENVALNFGTNAVHRALAADCFEYLHQTDEQYDIMVLDPPAFAKNIRSVTQASRGYKDLNMTAIKKIKPGGLIFTFSCSQHIDKELFRKIVFGAAADAGRNVRVLHQLTQPLDHPINIYHPEGEYLKGLVLHVE